MSVWQVGRLSALNSGSGVLWMGDREEVHLRVVSGGVDGLLCDRC